MEEGQVCAVQNDDEKDSRQHLPSSSKQQDALTDPLEGSNGRFVNDQQQLLRFLPEELWLVVFEKLDSSDDLERVSNSSPFFRQLLLSERVKFLFKNVWQILGWKYEEYFTQTDDDDDDGSDDDDDDVSSDDDDDDVGSDDDHDDVGGNENNDDVGGNDDDDDVDDAEEGSNEPDGEDTDDQTNDLHDVCTSSGTTADLDGISDVNHFGKIVFPPPELMCSQPDGAIQQALSLRLVCRTWSKDIDKLYEKRNVKLERMGDVTGLISHFGATHGSVVSTRSPFLGRNFTIKVAGHNDNIGLEFENKIQTILDKYGQHFLQCRFSVFHSDLLVASYCSRFRTMLQKMPNLRKLEFMRAWAPRPFTTNELEEMEAEVNANPFLPLKELQELTVEHVPFPVFQQLIRVNGHASTSTTKLADFVGDSAVLDSPFVSNLKLLSVLRCVQTEFEMITGAQFDWQLTKLHLDLRQCAFTVWQSVFLFNGLGNKFGKTLTELRLNMPETTSKNEWERAFEESKSYKLHLPHLAQLELTLVVGNLPCMDFLLPMKDSLRRIVLTVEEPYIWKPWMKRIERYDAGVVKIWSYFQCSSESNVWTLFPKLEKFRIIDYAFGDKVDRRPGQILTFFCAADGTCTIQNA